MTVNLQQKIKELEIKVSASSLIRGNEKYG